MNSQSILVGLALLVFLVGLRHFAARRVAAGQGQFVWLLFAPTIFGAVAILWAAAQLLPHAPVVGVLIGIGAMAYAVIVIGFLARLSRSATSSDSREEIVAKSVNFFADYAVSIVGIILIGSLVAIVGLIVWVVMSGSR